MRNNFIWFEFFMCEKDKKRRTENGTEPVATDWSISMTWRWMPMMTLNSHSSHLLHHSFERSLIKFSISIFCFSLLLASLSHCYCNFILIRLIYFDAKTDWRISSWMECCCWFWAACFRSCPLDTTTPVVSWQRVSDIIRWNEHFRRNIIHSLRIWYTANGNDVGFCLTIKS